MNGDSFHKAVTGLVGIAVVAAIGFAVDVSSDLARLQLQIETANARSAEILEIVNAVHPRAGTP